MRGIAKGGTPMPLALFERAERRARKEKGKDEDDFQKDNYLCKHQKRSLRI